VVAGTIGEAVAVVLQGVGVAVLAAAVPLLT
jgi:phosphoglycerate dehydrogenase-like enzyme